MRNAIWSVRATPASVAAPSIAAAPMACPPERPPASIRLDTVTPSGSLWRKMAMNTITPSVGRTRNALAMATPSKNVCNSRPTTAELPATRLTACVSSPRWKCGVTVCWVKCTARYPARTSAGAAAPERANASGKSSTTATASMNPAPNATKCSIRASSRAARRATARAPATFPRAATRAYSSALDTSEQLLPRVARGVVEHVAEQPRQRLAHLRAGSHPRRDEIVAADREVLQSQRVLGGADRLDDVREL